MTDPAAAPAQVAGQLAADLPEVLSEQLEGDWEWRVERQPEHLPPGDSQHTQMFDLATERMREHGWDLTICITDLPLRAGRQPIVADMSSERRALVVSLPAFGWMRLRRRVRNVVLQLIADMFDTGTPPDSSAEHRRRRLPVLGRRFRRVTPAQQGIDVRMLASLGLLRLLIGMVRDNRPWRLVFSLAGPLAGAFAFSAFYLITTSVWELGTAMGPLRLAAVALGSIVVMVTWLIVYHGLWEPSRGRPVVEGHLAALFNASTVLTFVIGVACGYAVLYSINLIAASIVLTPDVFGQYVIGDLGVGDYATVMLLVTSAATIAGAVGSGFETEDAIREAAYSYRERERRQALEHAQQRREEREGWHQRDESGRSAGT